MLVYQRVYLMKNPPYDALFRKTPVSTLVNAESQCGRLFPLCTVEILRKWLVDVSSMVFRNVENIQLQYMISTFDDIPIFPWNADSGWLVWFFHWGIPGSPMAIAINSGWLGRSNLLKQNPWSLRRILLSFNVWSCNLHQFPMKFIEIPVFQSWLLCLVLFFLQSLSPNSIPVLKKHRKRMENSQYHVISSTKAERLDVALQSPSAGVSRQVALLSLQRSERYGDIVLNILSYCMILIDIVQFRWYYIYIYTFCNMICRIYIYIYIY